ncbi:hypothetical protein DENSPDRAFT_836465 [Dentipellis sp. KUC8613]|nr:hypothetical protein DENSPDRAFT_836465 [Dentipellis sp. KUC8613]
MSQYAHLSEVDPEIQPLLAAFPPTPDWGTMEATVIQNFFVSQFLPTIMENRRPLLPPESAYKVEDLKIPVDGAEMAVRLLTPTPEGAPKDSTYPLFYWVHGGGWMFGNLDSDDFLLRRICVELQISVVNIEYRLAPQHPFPVGLNDSYEGLKWAAAHPEALSASLEKGFILGGQSSGANYAAAIALRARDDPFFEGRRLTGQVLQIPHVIHAEAYPEKYKDELLSVEQNKAAPILDRPTLDDYYRRLAVKPTDLEFSPLLAASHAGLPPTAFQLCGMDPFRDEGFLYAKILGENGVPTKVDVYPGVPHGFHLVFAKSAAAIKYDKELNDGIQWLLDGAKTK